MINIPIPKPSKEESQNDFMGRCMGFMKNDTSRPHDQQIAICMSSWREAKGGKKPTENLKDWHVVEYSVPIKNSVTEKSKGVEEFFVTGIAINETTTRNNIRYSAEELEPAASSLIDKPILKDHRNEIDAIVGRVKEASYDKKLSAIPFKGKIMDSKIKEMINDGRINKVSIGARVKDLVEEKIGEETVRKAVGIEFMELSLVAVPGDPDAGINHSFETAIAESFDLKNKSECVDCNFETEKLKTMEAEKMDEKVLAEKDAKIKELEKSLADKEAKEKEIALREQIEKEVIEKIKKEEQKKADEAKRTEEVEKVKPKSTVKDTIETKNERIVHVEKYGKGRIEIWTEPDAKGGLI